MTLDYYVDESGNTGDLVRAGGAFDFGQQPIFALACVGVDDLADLEREIARLKTRHNIRAAELKSTAMKDKPGLVADLAAYLDARRLPVFVEVVDKCFFICATMVNTIIMPPIGAMDFDHDSTWLRNLFGEHLRATMPAPVMRVFIEACDSPSIENTRRVFDALLNWLRSRMPADELAVGMERFAADTYSDFEATAAGVEPDRLAFLPLPDMSKKGKPFWMLPNLSSFANIYARINLFNGRKIAGLRILHDEQLQYDAILEDGKVTAETLRELGLTLSLPHADFAFTEQAQLAFGGSEASAGIQVADVLAGFVMRYVQDVIVLNKRPPPRHAEAFQALLGLSEPARGIGINLVLCTPDVMRLGVVPAR